MLDIFIKSIKPELGFITISNITHAMNDLIQHLNENNFIDDACRNQIIDYIIFMIEAQKKHE